MKKEAYAKVYTRVSQRETRRVRRRGKRRLPLLIVSAFLIATVVLFLWVLPVFLWSNEKSAAPGVAPVTEDSPPGSSGASSALPTQKATDWNLIVVNPWNSIPEGYEVSLAPLENGHSVDERCYPDLREMIDDCRAAGLSPLICSSYRTPEKQEQLFNTKVKALIAQGYKKADAHAAAGKEIAVPGTSEHQLGLAVDIVDTGNQRLDMTQKDTAVQQWLMRHSWEYGFILRYPADKSEITGIMYEPWHYRYVGKEAAASIYETGMCLEEYREQLR